MTEAIVPGNQVPDDGSDDTGQHHHLGDIGLSTIPLPMVVATLVEIMAPAKLSPAAMIWLT